MFAIASFFPQAAGGGGAGLITIADETSFEVSGTTLVNRAHGLSLLEDDVLVVQITCDDPQSTNETALANGGYTAIVEEGVTVTPFLGVYAKVMGSTPDTTTPFQPTNKRLAVRQLALRGCDVSTASSFVHVAGVPYLSPRSVTSRANDITTTVANSFVLFTAGKDDIGTTLVSVADGTWSDTGSQASTAVSSNSTLAWASKVVVTPSLVGTAVATYALDETGSGVMVAFK